MSSQGTNCETLAQSFEGHLLISYRATSFGVGVDFLLMMAQTLAERHTNQLMGLFRKAAAITGASGAASPVNAGFPSGISAPDTATSTGESLKRTASGSGNRPSSPTSIRKDSPLSRPDTGASGAGTPLKTSLPGIRPPITSRSATPSAAPTVLTQNLASAMSQNLSPPPSKRPQSPLLPRHRPSALHISTTSPPPHHQSPEESPSSPAKSDSSSSSSSGSSLPVESRIIKRPPRSHPKPGPSASPFPDDDDDEEEEAEPAFLPYKSPPQSAGSSDLGATLRGAPSSSSSRRPPRAASKAAGASFLSSREGSSVSDRHAESRESQTSDSSTSSAAVGQRGYPAGTGRGGNGPLSPRRTAELAGKGKGRGREGSDGTPSMGSSFSDLDGKHLHPWMTREQKAGDLRM